MPERVRGQSRMGFLLRLGEAADSGDILRGDEGFWTPPPGERHATALALRAVTARAIGW